MMKHPSPFMGRRRYDKSDPIFARVYARATFLENIIVIKACHCYVGIFKTVMMTWSNVVIFSIQLPFATCFLSDFNPVNPLTGGFNPLPSFGRISFLPFNIQTINMKLQCLDTKIAK